jgi:N-acetylmuramoyl-L-alanine amidase
VPGQSGLTERGKQSAAKGAAGGDTPESSSRPFPRVSRHLSGDGKVYSPNSADWLRQPSREGKTRNGGAGGSKGGALPPAGTRTTVRRKRGGAFAVKIGAAAIALIFVVSLAFQQLRSPSDPTPTIAPTATTADPSGGGIPVFGTPTLTSTPTTTPTPTLTPTATATFTPTATPTPDARFAGKTVCIDPGHGGTDTGFVRQADDAAPAMRETDYNLKWALDLRDRLEADGLIVVMTRTEDVDVNADFKDVNGDGQTWKNVSDPDARETAKNLDELQARINICNAAGANLLISMHINGFDDSSADGYEAWYSGARMDADASMLLANILVEEFGNEMSAAGYNGPSRGARNDDNADAEIRHGALAHYVMIGPAQTGVSPSQMPGIIGEAGFISNDDDAAFMHSDKGADAIVKAYEKAIIRYFIQITQESVYGAQ